MEETPEYTTMDRNALALNMLHWYKIQEQADELAAAIRDTVLDLGETVTTGLVRASYSKGRKTYDYRGVGSGKLREGNAKVYDQIIEANTTLVPKIDWRHICFGDLGLDTDDIPFIESDPSVTIKVLY